MPNPPLPSPNPQQVLPVPEIAFEAYAPGNLKGRDGAPRDFSRIDENLKPDRIFGEVVQTGVVAVSSDDKTQESRFRAVKAMKAQFEHT